MGKDYLLLVLVFYPMAGALAGYIAGRYSRGLRDNVVLFVTFSEFAACLYLMCTQGGLMPGFGTAARQMDAGGLYCELPGIAGLGISFMLDGFRIVYILVVSFMWMMTTLLSREYFVHYRNRNRYYMFVLLTYGATMGVFLSADLYTTFLFFEMLSLTSYAWVAHDERKESMRAAGTYLGIAIIGGLAMLMGLFLYVDIFGSAQYRMLAEKPFLSADWGRAAAEHQKQLWIAGLCMLAGFGAKAGAFPLHVWLPKAHPVAPAPASALLSGVLTKSGIFGILILSCYLFAYDRAWGILILALGVVTMLGGALLALASVDLKRTLACSSMSQIGFILVGIGMMQLLQEENVLAVRGTILYMVNHSLFKLVLFMAAGIVFMNTHKLNLNDVRGFGRKKPLLHLSFLLGMLGISGVPLLSGYVGKTLLHESIAEYIAAADKLPAAGMFPGGNDMRAVEWLFIICGGMTLAYMLKLYVCLFLQKNKDAALQERYDGQGRRYMNKGSAFALAGSAALLPVMGMLPHLTMDRLADLGQAFCYPVGLSGKVDYFSPDNIKGAVVSLLIGIIIYLIVILGCMYWKGSYHNLWPSILDLENLLYRPVLLFLLPVILGSICRVLDRLVDYMIILLRKTIYRDSPIPHELGEGTIITHAVGVMLDDGVGVINHTIRRKKPIQISFEHRLASLQDMLAENNVIIGRSLSFGLLLFVVGLTVTLFYMLLR